MFAELYLTDGETKIDLLGANRNGVGIALNRMTLSRPQREPSGAFRQVYGAVNESYELKITDRGHDAIAARQQGLDRLLEQAANYFTGNVENNVVWMCARTADESNPRYALVFGGMIDSYDDVYNQPFTGSNGLSTINEITLVLERSTWQANPPTEPECVALTNAVDWNPSTQAWSSVRTLTNVQSLLVTANGKILAGGANIERSEDEGQSWTVELTGNASGRFWQILEVPARLWAVFGVVTGSPISASGIYASIDSGDNWATYINNIDFYSVCYRPQDKTVFFGGNNEIRYLLADLSFVTMAVTFVGQIKAMVVTSTGAILFSDEYNTWRIPPDSYVAEITESEDIGPFLQIVAVENYLLLTSATYISISRDDGLTWLIYWRDWGTDAIFVLDNGHLFASRSGDNTIYISTDSGFSWQEFAIGFAGIPIRAFAEKIGTYLFVGAGNTIDRRIASDATVAYGPFEPDCTTSVFIANHRLESNWTHILIFNSSSSNYTTITPADVATNNENQTDQLSFPSPVGTNDAMYIGISTILIDAGPFSNVYIELTERNHTLTLAIEYYNGSAWTALTTANMQDNTQSLKRSGIIAWHLDPAVAQSPVAINGVTAYWIRIRVTATGSLSTLLPKFRNIYITQQPYIEIDNLAGDIPALAQITLSNRLGTDLIVQPTDRVLMGLRSVERGERFTAYINLAQKQNPSGITVDITGTNSVFVTGNTVAAAGEFIRNTLIATDAWVTAVVVTMDTNLAAHFAGTYQIYLRYYYPDIGATSARLLFTSFGYFLESEIVGQEITFDPNIAIDATDFAQNIHMGQFTIAPDRQFSYSDASTQLRIELQIKAAVAGNDVDLFELILIPADEWIGDFGSSPHGAAFGGTEHHADIDSATFPKRVLRSLLRRNGSNLVDGIWQPSASGAFTLQPGQKQRLWMLFESWVGSWRASPHTLVHQAKLWHHARWLGLRGND